MVNVKRVMECNWLQMKPVKTNQQVTNDPNAAAKWIEEFENSYNKKTDQPLNIGLDAEWKPVDLRERAVEKGYFQNLEKVGISVLAEKVLGKKIKKGENVRMSIWHKTLSEEH
ncbi:Werner syndrome-like exonuclease, partial [Tanacetum coccineum]